MSDDIAEPVPVETPGENFAAVMASHAVYRKRAAALIAGNKTALFAALHAANISHVTVEFDGAGDSGQVESIAAYRDELAVDLPETEITITSACWGDPGFVARTMTIEQAIEQLAYDFLADTHGGWENNDGAYGEFCFDVREGTIHLDYNERFTSSEYSCHEF